jgi:hypothetical protein
MLDVGIVDVGERSTVIARYAVHPYRAVSVKSTEKVEQPMSTPSTCLGAASPLIPTF